MSAHSSCTPGEQLPVVWAPEYEVDIGRHVYPTAKYRLVKERIVQEGTISERDLHRPSPASRADLERVHAPDYLDRIEAGQLTAAEIRRLETPFSPKLREAFILSCGGTTLTAELALQAGVAVHLGGGFHHGFADHGEGFCLLNDVAVALRSVVSRGSVSRAAVVDLDVHHGNGTAAIFRDDPAVFTFSMHQERNYPFAKPPSDLDVGLEDGTGDAPYLEALQDSLLRILERHLPELVLYLAGVDPFHEDQLGGLGLTRGGLRERDRFVLETCRRADIPVAVTLAGGYAFRLADTLELHANTVREASRILDEESEC